MGAFIVSMHIRTNDQEAVVRALRELQVARCRVTPAVNDWVSVYEESASMQDAGRICELTSALSERLDTVGIGFLIHDSDFACHWLFDKGRQVDEYNSCPDYFGDDAEWDEDEPAASGGQPDVLLRYCREGTTLQDVEAALVPALAFAEMQVERVAQVLGIDARHVLADYNDFANGEADDLETTAIGGDDADTPPPRSLRGLSLFDPSGEVNDPGVNRDPTGLGGALREIMSGMFGGRPTATAADPRNAALVQAAVAGDVARIDELLAEGADVNAPGPMRMSGVLGMPAVHQAPQFEAPPLLAAIAHNRLDAARRLIDRGADVRAGHPLFGSTVHAAVTTGAPELLRLLLDHGADANAKDLGGRTALQALKAHRQMIRQFSEIQSSLGSLGIPIPNMNLPQPATPTEGWEECELILREAGGR